MQAQWESAPACSAHPARTRMPSIRGSEASKRPVLSRHGRRTGAPGVPTRCSRRTSIALFATTPTSAPAAAPWTAESRRPPRTAWHSTYWPASAAPKSAAPITSPLAQNAAPYLRASARAMPAKTPRPAHTAPAPALRHATLRRRLPCEPVPDIWLVGCSDAADAVTASSVSSPGLGALIVWPGLWPLRVSPDNHPIGPGLVAGTVPQSCRLPGRPDSVPAFEPGPAAKSIPATARAMAPAARGSEMLGQERPWRVAVRGCQSVQVELLLSGGNTLLGVTYALEAPCQGITSGDSPTRSVWSTALPYRPFYP
eukprot:scaffold51_cov401-Prasinococcus_capsulatus_cf.AAC.37